MWLVRQNVESSLACADISILELVSPSADSIPQSLPVLLRSLRKIKVCHGTGSIFRSSEMWMGLATGVMEEGSSAGW